MLGRERLLSKSLQLSKLIIVKNYLRNFMFLYIRSAYFFLSFLAIFSLFFISDSLCGRNLSSLYKYIKPVNCQVLNTLINHQPFLGFFFLKYIPDQCHSPEIYTGLKTVFHILIVPMLLPIHKYIELFIPY